MSRCVRDPEGHETPCCFRLLSTAEKPEITRVSSSPMPSAVATPATPPIPDRNAASSRNCTSTSLPARADGQPQPDLARALGHADEHHVGDPDRADEQADAGQGDRHQPDARAQSVERRDDLIRRGQGEVVVGRRRQLAQQPQDRLGLREQASRWPGFARM